MLSLPIVLVLVVVAGFIVWLVRQTWRSRQIDFIHRVDVAERSGAVADYLFDYILPSLTRDGYTMVAQAGNTTVFEHRFIYGWAYLVAFLFFPVGLLALLVRGRERVVVISGPDAVEVNGSCPKPVADWIVAVLGEAALFAAELPQA